MKNNIQEATLNKYESNKKYAEEKEQRKSKSICHQTSSHFFLLYLFILFVFLAKQNELAYICGTWATGYQQFCEFMQTVDLATPCNFVFCARRWNKKEKKRKKKKRKKEREKFSPEKRKNECCVMFWQPKCPHLTFFLVSVLSSVGQFFFFFFFFFKLRFSPTVLSSCVRL